MTEEILVVDDDRDIRALLEYAFEDEGFEVTTFDNGEAALTYLSEGGRPACILLDLVMPGVDGLDVLEECAGDDELAAIPVVVLTGLGDDETVDEVLEKGADDFVTKPFRSSELVTQVKQLLA